MNIEGRYENCLSDIITLLQQATYRFITDQQVDLSKFFQYFKQFYRNLASLEECFHQSKIKFTKYLSKINTLTQQIQFNKSKTISLEPSKKDIIKTKLPIHQASSKQYITTEKTQKLNVIGEIQERQDFDDIRFNVNQDTSQIIDKKFQSRIGTADGSRHKMSVTIDFQNSRPYTGNYNNRNAIRKSSQKLLNKSKQRYRSLTKYERTVNESEDNGYSTQQKSQAATQKKLFNIGQRKSIYDVLEQQKKSRKNMIGQQFLQGDFVKLPQKRKDKGFSRWSFKINKLL